MLEIRNLNKNFKNVPALKNININIAKGDILSILGESGAGKTTLLRSLTGLEKCNSGTIKIEDTYLLKDNKYCSSKELLNIRKKIGLVFQGFNLFPHMTVLENIIESPVYVHKAKKEDAIINAKKLLLKLGISEKENSYPYELSGGQKQRVAIARALILNPCYICFDEPTSALDPKTTLEVANIIKNLSKDIGVIIITHDMDFAKLISSRIVELASGKIIFDASSSNYWCQKAN
ncbi:amino acid ABC transporter ATP-binding protein [uncultured Clostridium sp.]|jgi:polar amino acid transport system ATP-binding protein|uniref:amino acid ABC transporter ATP-binding protein n=1 Tax=uncultured Clostridium sp. TaxID=59620 RepID=UPI002621BE39|nr:amino acid ABC transporter ATP-binding protein [uncultured Clostridium sp.]